MKWILKNGSSLFECGIHDYVNLRITRAKRKTYETFKSL
jgi:hypothetical protein